MSKIPVEIVRLYRAGSGGYLVNGGLSHRGDKSSFEKWAKDLGSATGANYGEIQLIISSPPIEGYDGYPGCSITFLLGNKDGVIQNVWKNGKSQGDIKAGEPLQENIESVLASDFPGNLTLEFSFDDLEKLHMALGKVIKYNKEQKKKSK